MKKYVLATALLCGCPTFTLHGEAGVFEFGWADTSTSAVPDGLAVATSAYGSIDETTPFLAGTSFCTTPDVSIPQPAGAPTDWWTQCWDLVATNAVPDEGDGWTCWALGNDDAVFDFTPRDCDWFDAAELTADRITLDVLAAGSFRAVLNAWPEVGGVGFAYDAAGTPFDTSIAEPLPQPARVWPGRPLRLEVGFVDSADSRLAAWNPSRGTVEVVRVEGAAISPVDLGDVENNVVGVKVPAGAVARIDVTIDGETFAAGTLEAAKASEAASLEVDLAFESADPLRPLGARAVVSDGEGRRIYGAPIRWTHEGPPMVLRSRDSTNGPPVWMGLDYVEWRDDCEQPSARAGGRSASLTATVGGLSQTVSASWTNPVEDEASWSAPSGCKEPGTVACTAGGAGTSAFSLLALLAIRARIAASRRR